MRAAALVELTTSATALETALSVPDLKEAALSNGALPAHLWFAQYAPRPKPSAKHAGLLVKRRLEPDQLDHVIAQEARATVLTNAFKVTRPTLAQLHALLDSKALSTAVADKVVDTLGDVVDVDWLRTAAAKVGGSARMEYYLRAPHETTDTDLIAALTDYNSWGAEWDTARWHRLLTSRPSVLPGAVRSDSQKVRTAAAGCRFLTDPAMQRLLADLDAPEAADPESMPKTWGEERSFTWTALVSNPTCDLDVVRELDPIMKSLEDWDTRYRASNRLQRNPFTVTAPFQDVEDHTQIAFLLRRTLPGKSKDAGRPYDLPALLENPHLTATEATEIFVSLASAHETVADAEVRDPLLALVKRFPDEAAANNLSVDRVFEAIDGQARAAQIRIAEHGNDILADAPVPATDEEAERGADATVRSLSYNSRAFEYAVGYLDRNVTDTVDAWHVVYRLLDRGDFPGTVADLVTVANATA